MELKRARTMGIQERSGAEMLALLKRVDETPAANTVKGMYIIGILDALSAHGVKRPELRVQSFKDYPLRGFMELELDAAITLYPALPVREALRKLGRQALSIFANSIVGGVIMGTIGRSWQQALKLISKGYELSLKPGKASITDLQPGRATLELRQVWNFGDSYQVGVLEELMDWCDIRGTVSAREVAPGDTNLKLEWAQKSDSSHES